MPLEKSHWFNIDSDTDDIPPYI